MDAAITRVTGQAFTIPTDRPEADGTLEWDSTTIVVAEVSAAGQTGVGYTYSSVAAAVLVHDFFAKLLVGQNAFDIEACWRIMQRKARNLGVNGQVATAIAAIDTALWDLKAKLLNLSLADLFGVAQESVPVYGSGGFTTYSLHEIEEQITGWMKQGITRAKIKIGTHPDEDEGRVQAARKALGENNQLFVDANGAYSVKQAMAFAKIFCDSNVVWFEEPVTSDNLPGLRQIREHGPAGMDITAGEYGFDLFTHQHMLEAQAVDVLQPDVTRCQGYTGFMQVAGLATSYNIPISSHCAPALHVPICAHYPHLRHMEYFHDHVRIEQMLFDNLPVMKNGALLPNRSAPGHGLVLKKTYAERYAA